MPNKKCSTAGKRTKSAKTKSARRKNASVLASACKKQANRRKRLTGKSIYKKKK